MITKDLETQSEKFEFQLRPFSDAFKNGFWLLLDELNLAPDIVLQCIENALDTKELKLHNPCDAEIPVQLIPMHDNFRLFATQNPDNGFFKGKREKLSPALIDRFTTKVFEEFPKNELIEIVYFKLRKVYDEKRSKELSETIVDIHDIIRQKVNQKDFKEKTSYAEVTVRELLKLCDRMCHLQRNAEQRILDDNKVREALGFSVYLIYGSRFRNEGLIKVKETMAQFKLGSPCLTQAEYNFENEKVIIDNCHFPKYDLRPVDESVNKNEVYQAFEVHLEVLSESLRNDFIRQHGIYVIDASILNKWVQRCDLNEVEFSELGFQLYARIFRHKHAQKSIQDIFRKCYQRDFGLNKIESGYYERPFVPTARVLNLWKQVLWSLEVATPILVTGTESCGKSESLYVLSKLARNEIKQVCLSPETEVSHLVGQYSPSEKSSDTKIAWKDGYITSALRNGHWVLLDNLNQTDACVLERLNPLLESEPVWVLAEKGETQEMENKSSFKVLATMTTSSSYDSANNYQDLSPALYNRFSIINMQDIDDKNETAFKQEFTQLVGCLLETSDDVKVVHVCWMIYSESRKKEMANKLGIISFRSLVRFIDFCFYFTLEFSQFGIEQIIWKAYQVCFVNQVKIDCAENQIFHEKVKNYLKINKIEIDLLKGWNFEDKGYIITESKRSIIETVIACIKCKVPVLLEGIYFYFFSDNQFYKIIHYVIFKKNLWNLRYLFRGVSTVEASIIKQSNLSKTNSLL